VRLDVAGGLFAILRGVREAQPFFVAAGLGNDGQRAFW
jgi:hypothetical protein